MIPAKYRKTVYLVVAVAFAGLFAFGVFTPDEVDAAIVNAERIVAALTSLLALLNVTPDPN